MPKTKKVEKSGAALEGVLDLLKQISGELGSLNDRIASVEKTQGLQSATEATKDAIDKANAGMPKVEVKVDETIQEKRIDLRYRKIVDGVLGEQFDAWEEYEGCPPSHFRFVISVPKELSSVPQQSHVLAKCDHENKVCKLPPDLRSRTMSYALGENGVREWCTKVRLNLNKFYTQNAISSPFKTADIL